jgi:hypothetical protein
MQVIGHMSRRGLHLVQWVYTFIVCHHQHSPAEVQVWRSENTGRLECEEQLWWLNSICSDTFSKKKSPDIQRHAIVPSIQLECIRFLSEFLWCVPPVHEIAAIMYVSLQEAAHSGWEWAHSGHATTPRTVMWVASSANLEFSPSRPVSCGLAASLQWLQALPLQESPDCHPMCILPMPSTLKVVYV